MAAALGVTGWSGLDVVLLVVMWTSAAAFGWLLTRGGTGGLGQERGGRAGIVMVWLAAALVVYDALRRHGHDHLPWLSSIAIGVTTFIWFGSKRARSEEIHWF